MKKSSKFSPERRERAVRRVQEQRGEYPSMWVAIASIAPVGVVPEPGRWALWLAALGAWAGWRRGRARHGVRLA
ncbi:hypothetical protein N4G63_021425 [Aquabacterium sp. OR-4]|nr:PEP-CTERM sorting domain-containing protein [Aquabacterium sp. OR-4]MDT7837751.1 hypothetical protein [Aquabacterium sp. OR-4]